MYRLEGLKSKKAAKTSSDLSFPRLNRILSQVKIYISVLTCVESGRGVCLFLRTEAYYDNSTALHGPQKERLPFPSIVAGLLKQRNSSSS